MIYSFNLLAVIGPTASGKTEFAAHLADAAGGEIISADSRQVYRRMDLGTGKDYNDYLVNGKTVPVHLIDVAEPGYHYSLFEYQRDFFRVFHDLQARKKLPVLCGGSGMYIDAVTRTYRLSEVPRNEVLRKEMAGRSLAELHQLLASMKKLHNTTDVDTSERAIRAMEIALYQKQHPDSPENQPRVIPFFLGIIFDRETERKRITRRLTERMNHGMIEEVKQLLDSGISHESMHYYGLEYRLIASFLRGEINREDLFNRLNTAIHQFAKRQRTWFRKMEKEGTVIHWIDGKLPLQEKLCLALQLIGL